jgi:hypothetical protein
MATAAKGLNNHAAETNADEVPLKKCTDEVLRKIGRNLVVYQQIESMLKTLIANRKLSGTEKELQEKLAAQNESVQNLSLGMLTNEYNKQLTNNHDALPKATTELWASFTFVRDQRFAEQQNEALEKLVIIRNELAHQLLKICDFGVIESVANFDAYLEQQYKKAQAVHSNLMAELKDFAYVQSALAAFLGSEAYEKHTEIISLQQSRIVSLLCDISDKNKRDDGWTLLGKAAQLLDQFDAEEIKTINERYGFRSLKKLMLASDLFDFKDEPTNKCGTRTVYRCRNANLN